MSIHQLPSVGRIVHFYRELKEGPIAAIVTTVYEPDSPTVELTLFLSTSHQQRTNVPFSPKPAVDCWTWPPRVP